MKFKPVVFAVSAALVSSATLCVGTANASNLTFTYLGENGDFYVFEQPSDPASLGPPSVKYAYVFVTGLASNLGSFNQLAWYTTAYSGGFATFNGRYTGDQVFTGPVAHPIFSVGTFDLVDNGVPGVLTIALPEPAAWTVMLLGMLGVGGALRLRRRSVGVQRAVVAVA